jgi:hypothetical protein
MKPGRLLSHLIVASAALSLAVLPASAAHYRSKLVVGSPHRMTAAALEIPQYELRTLLTKPRRLSPQSWAVTNTFDINIQIIQKPGTSATLFATPYYSCQTFRYISTAGSDSYDGTSATHTSGTVGPWLTLNHADATIPNPAPGYCITVANGTYNGISPMHGGNLASSTGYVVYKCATLGGCTLNGSEGNGDSVEFACNHANYVMFDGFILVGSNTENSSGVDAFCANPPDTTVSSHHLWLLNSVVYGFGQSGMQMNGGDYYYVIHSILHDNSKTCPEAQGSGISLASDHDLSGYTPTADDKVPNAVFGFPTWTISSGVFFHNVIAWSVLYNNTLAVGCGYVTDGNGIIFDTQDSADGNSTNYTEPTLVAFSVIYNNGGAGPHPFGAVNVYLANNSVYNNYLSAENTGTERGGIDTDTSDASGKLNYNYNNISVAVPTASGNLSYNTALSSSGPQYSIGNMTYLTHSTAAAGEVVLWSSTQTTDACTVSAWTNVNFCHTNPLWVNVGNSSTGSNVTPPVGANFALQATSPAIGVGTVPAWLPAQAADLGACHHSFSTCP